MIKRPLIQALALTAGLAAGPALAANDAMLQLLEALKAKGTIDEETYAAIRLAAVADEEQNAAAGTELKEATAALPRIDTRGKLEIASPSGDFKWRLGGRVHLDGAWFDNDRGTSRSTSLADGTEFRRARMDVTATLWRAWQLKLQYDFANSGSAGIRDAYIRYSAPGGPFPWYAMVGNFKVPFSLEEYGTSNGLTFLERALPNALAPARKIGVGVGTTGHDLWSVQAGVFGEGVSPENNQPGCSAAVDAGTGTVTPCTGNDGEGYAVAGRLVVSPWHSESSDRVLHFGIATEYRLPDEGERVRFRQRPESNLADRLIDTGNLTGVDSTHKLGFEAAGNYGPFSLQGEYIMADVEREGRLASPDFDGWYVMGSYLLTGESRTYKFPEGGFDNPKPRGVVGQGGIGAWELTARISELDLNDRVGLVAFNGGRMQNVTAGLNWYPTPNFRFMANYTRVLDLEDADAGSFDGVEPAVFALRAQAHW